MRISSDLYFGVLTIVELVTEFYFLISLQHLDG